MSKPNATGEGSELPAMSYTPTDEDYKAVANSDPRTRAAMAACFLAADRQLKAALSSPQQEFRWIPCEQELPSIGQTVIVQGGIAYRVEDEWISQTGGASGRPIMWPVTHWAKIPDIPAPPVTAEGTKIKGEPQ